MKKKFRCLAKSLQVHVTTLYLNEHPIGCKSLFDDSLVNLRVYTVITIVLYTVIGSLFFKCLSIVLFVACLFAGVHKLSISCFFLLLYIHCRHYTPSSIILCRSLGKHSAKHYKHAEWTTSRNLMGTEF